METKKAHVTKVTKMDKQDNYGNFSYVIEFSNSDKGFYVTKESEQKKFIIGNEAEYTIEKKTGATGKEYFKISLPKVEGNFQPGGFKGKPTIDPRIQFIGFSHAYAKDLAVAGRIPLKDVSAYSDIFFNNMIKLYQTISK